jgi:hypothetical protein
VFYEEIEACHPKEHEQGVRASILGEADVVGHEGQRKGTGKGDERRKLSCKQIDHGDGEDSEDQGDNPEVSFGFGERIELVGENEEKGRVKIRRILFIEFYLAFEVVSGVIEGMDFVHPERFLIESVEPQRKAYKETEKKGDNFLLPFYINNGASDIHHGTEFFLAIHRIETPKGKEKYFSI